MWLALLLVGTAAAAYFHAQGYLLYYGDAEAHLETARRIIDSRTPGYDQIGSPWLPLPHVLMLPFIGNEWLWRTGLAGTIPGVLCFAVAGTFLFATVRMLFGAMPALCAVSLFALNPNLLYLQAIPMTEPVLLACLMGLLYSTVLFGRTQSLWAAFGAGICSLAATMTRYDGWFLLPFVTLYLFVAGGQKRWAAVSLYCVLAGSGPVYWFAHNHFIHGDWLNFYRGPYSAKAIQGGRPYPGYHDLSTAVRYYYEAVNLCMGAPLIFIGAAGLLAALWKRAWWAAGMMALIPLFYVVSMYSSGNPIHVPTLWPNSYYNTRYGIGVLPLLCIGAAGLVAIVPPRIVRPAVAVTVLAASLPWILYPRSENWITWKESEVNSNARRQWTRELAEFFKENYRPGSGILFSWGDLTGVFREAGIPFRETLHIGNGPHFDGSIARPDLFLWEEWVVAISADPVSAAMVKLMRSGPVYDRVRTVYVPGGPVIEIHRRTHDYSIHQNTRRPQ